MNPANRQMLKVSTDDESEAYSIISTLMGETVAPRRSFI